MWGLHQADAAQGQRRASSVRGLHQARGREVEAGDLLPPLSLALHPLALPSPSHLHLHPLAPPALHEDLCGPACPGLGRTAGNLLQWHHV